MPYLLVCGGRGHIIYIVVDLWPLAEVNCLLSVIVFRIVSGKLEVGEKKQLTEDGLK